MHVNYLRLLNIYRQNLFRNKKIIKCF